MRISKYWCLYLKCIFVVISFSASAATQTSTMAASATVTTACTITANPLVFGTYNGAQLDSTTTIIVNCTNGGGYTVYMGPGTGTGATTTVRKLTSSSNTLNYAIYTDSGRTILWKDSAGPNVTGTGNGANQTLTAYGRMPAQTTPVVGSYTDSVIVTVSY